MPEENEAKAVTDEQSAKPAVNPQAKEHWKKGNSLFEESKFEEAIKEYTEAIRVDKTYADAYFNRALTERVINDFQSAKGDLEKVLEIQPKSYDAPLLIGDMAESKNDMLGARYWYERALVQQPGVHRGEEQAREDRFA
jgi:tetratricopeptide (TPR) repeat protein